MNDLEDASEPLLSNKHKQYSTACLYKSALSKFGEFKTSLFLFLALASSHPKQEPPQTNYYAHFDGLRGLASLAVFTHHFFLKPCGPIINFSPFLYATITAGKPAVDIFFIISGRVVCSSVLSKPCFRNFSLGLIKRHIRLWFPMLIVWIYQYSLCNLNAYNVSSLPDSDLDSTKYIKYSSNCVNSLSQAIHQSYDMFYSHNTYGIGPFWTLILEMDFSIPLYCVAYFVSRAKYAKWIVYFFLIVYFIRLHSFFALFLIGLMQAEISQSRVFKWIQSRRFLYIPLQVFLMYLLYSCLLRDLKKIDRKFPYNYESKYGDEFVAYFDLASIKRQLRKAYRFFASEVLSSALIMAIAETSFPVQYVLSLLPLRLLGKASFGLYVLHPFTLGTFTPWMYAKVVGSGLSGVASVAFTYIATLAFLGVLCWLFYHVADLASSRLGRNVAALVEAVCVGSYNGAVNLCERSSLGKLYSKTKPPLLLLLSIVNCIALLWTVYPQRLKSASE